MYYLGVVVTGVGVLFLCLGGIGLFRFPDVYNRVQAGTKCTTLGAFATIIGVGIMEPTWFWKTLIIALFILATNPISSHSLGRAAYKSGTELAEGSVVDMASEFEEYSEE
ncbi:MAG: monovalent cation/H(+) antiporter subunit G [Candidatus Acetothermia bacterium]|nr:monovalent cation/H(+) antiporter subunit G [Candidatus Bipolaricaulota bacterium]